MNPRAFAALMLLIIFAVVVAVILSVKMPPSQPCPDWGEVPDDNGVCVPWGSTTIDS